MKNLLLVFSLLLSGTAFAETFNYHCVQKQWDEKMDIRITKTTMTFLNQVEGNSSSKVGDLVFVNRGLFGGNGKMKDKLSFVWSKEKSSIYNWNDVQRYYVQPELINGGIELKNGSLGGFITYEGQGYSYESFVCFRK